MAEAKAPTSEEKPLLPKPVLSGKSTGEMTFFEELVACLTLVSLLTRRPLDTLAIAAPGNPGDQGRHGFCTGVACVGSRIRCCRPGRTPQTPARARRPFPPPRASCWAGTTWWWS